MALTGCGDSPAGDQGFASDLRRQLGGGKQTKRPHEGRKLDVGEQPEQGDVVVHGRAGVLGVRKALSDTKIFRLRLVVRVVQDVLA